MQLKVLKQVEGDKDRTLQMLTGKIEGTDNLTVSFLPSPVRICVSFSGIYILSNRTTSDLFASYLQSTFVLVKFNSQRILLHEVLVMGVNCMLPVKPNVVT